MLEPGIADMHVGGAFRLRFDQNAGTAVVVEDRVGDVQRRGTARCKTHTVIGAGVVADAHASQMQRSLASHIDTGWETIADFIEHEAFDDHGGAGWRVDSNRAISSLPQSVPTGNRNGL